MMVPIDFLKKIVFLTILVKSVVLSWHYQLLFLYSGRFPGKKNWTGAQQAYCFQPNLKIESKFEFANESFVVN